MLLIDTHCHLQDSEFYTDEQREELYRCAVAADTSMICVGTDVRSSREAVAFARTHERCYAVVGIHPHEAESNSVKDIAALLHTHNKEGKSRIVGIGEIGLDYHYDGSTPEMQQQILNDQIQLALEYDLPISFHVRDAFDAFWPIFDRFSGVRGVLHSFTDSPENLQRGIENGLFVGINGISTFTRDEAQRYMYSHVPLEHVVLETDAPFLTPKPFRGKINTPAYVRYVAEDQATCKGVSVEHVAAITTRNAITLFRLDYERTR